MHEFVVSCTWMKKHGVKNIDVAKRMLDFGVHAPTVSFPLIVPDCLMIEPTESESRAQPGLPSRRSCGRSRARSVRSPRPSRRAARHAGPPSGRGGRGAQSDRALGRRDAEVGCG